MKLSVILPAHNPDATRLARTIDAVAAQRWSSGEWELVIVDNASTPPLALPVSPSVHHRARLVVEPRLGLSHARRTGVQQSSGEIVVFVDDDNVLAENYVETVANTFDRLPEVGALGGRCLGEFETAPQPWHEEFYPLLALRDLGDDELVCSPRDQIEPLSRYPECAPIGAGLAARRTALNGWLEAGGTTMTDRAGTALSSGGDNDIVLHVFRAGWGVAYIPGLSLRHLIPASRLQPKYLERLNRGIQKSWTEVLALHGVSPWPAVPAWTVPLRKAKAWFTHAAWRGGPSRIRWQGACGHFEGRATRPRRR